MKTRRWVLFLALLIAMLVLSGCGIPSEGVDIETTEPEGIWQSFYFWLARSLVWLNSIIVNQGIPYNWGFAIIAFTVIIRIALFPLTLIQIRGMEAQKKLQPVLQELQKKYGKDREKMAQEQMKLYREAGVNPLSGCLPLIAQMPILFGLYSALVALGPRYLEGAGFYWLPDLGFPRYFSAASENPSFLEQAQIGLNWLANDFYCLIGSYPQEGFTFEEQCVSSLVGYTPLGHLLAYLTLPVLLMASQYAMQKWMTPTPTAGDDQAGMTKQLMTMMTFMFGFFTLQVPAGLSLYWVTGNFLQMLQQWAITSERFKLFGAEPSIPNVVDGQVVVSSSDAVDAKNQNGSGPTGIQTGANGKASVSEKPKASNRSNKSRKSRKRSKRR